MCCARLVAAQTLARRFSLKRRGFACSCGSRHSSGRHGRPLSSDLHQCFVRELDHQPSDQCACVNTSSLMDCGPIVVSRSACRRSDVRQGVSTATTRLRSGLQSKCSSSDLLQFIQHGRDRRMTVSWPRRMNDNASGYPLRTVDACFCGQSVDIGRSMSSDTLQSHRHSLLLRRRDHSELARCVQALPLVFIFSSVRCQIASDSRI